MLCECVLCGGEWFYVVGYVVVFVVVVVKVCCIGLCLCVVGGGVYYVLNVCV